MLPVRPAVLLLAAGALVAPLTAQQGYREPPEPIRQMLDAAPTPSLTLSPRRDWFVVLERKGMPGIADVAAPHLKLGGTRIDPRTNGPAGAGGFEGMALQRVRDRSRVAVQFPAGGRLGSPQWAPRGDRFVFTQAETNGIALYLADTTGAVRRLVGPSLNAAHGAPCNWLDGGTRLVCAMIPGDRGPAPTRPDAPIGPAVQESDGRNAQAATFQDLLKDPVDEALFAHYFVTQYMIVDIGGRTTPLGPSGLVTGLTPSPDGRWFIAETVQRPFSYQFPWSRFPMRVEIWDTKGTVVKQLENRTTIETASNLRGSVLPGPRGWRWRGDAPATLMWTEALDGGDPRTKVAKRDRILALDAPFSGTPRTFAETEWRAGGITWGRADVALLSESWPQDRKTRTWIINPSNPSAAPRLLWERSSEDRYGNPGSPMMMQTADGRAVLQFSRDGNALWLTGQGASPEGDRPFLDRLNLATLKTTRLWRSAAPYFETIVAAVDADAGTFLTQRQSVDEPPNYWMRDVIRRRAPIQLTDAKDPAPAFAGITGQLVTYTRADGVQLSGTLYLPKGYDPTVSGPLPFVLWVYPAEFGSADAASQVSGSPYRFVRPGGASHLFLLTQGYGVLDNPTFPIVGKDGAEPNDTYVQQLEMSAQAAIDKLVEMGVGDRARMAVGGHSYGGFTTANLLAHTRLFRAGIARSGAYNRTLTPFGFQAEPRNYWEAQATYLAMSPFNYANRIKDPILFIHGMDDNNQGTFPIQSERMYAAVRGNGGTTKLVMLPGESHGYAARESIGHALAEMAEWLDRHLKPKRELLP